MAIPGVFYIKVAKIDKNGNDQTTTLQSLSNIVIPFSSGKQSYEITSITEYPTYFLFYLNEAGTLPDFSDRAEIEYDFTGSSPGFSYINPLTENVRWYLPFSPSGIDNLGFYISGSDSNLGGTTPSLEQTSIDSYRLVTYPQKSINIRISGSAHFDLTQKTGGTNITASLTIFKSPLITNNYISNYQTILGSLDLGVFTTSPTPITSSFDYSISTTNINPGDCIYFAIRGKSESSIGRIEKMVWNSSSIWISSSTSTGPTLQTIPEPYFSENFSLAYDCQPTFNNAVDPRRSALHQDIDYNTGLLNPTNFELLINGVALNAEVQNSNYTSLRHITSRYLGAKNQTEKINEWTDSDFNEGTYGKTPSIESRKTHIAYVDGIGGWNPDKLNASAIFIKYLINEDGDVIDPKISPNALGINRGTFESGERISISGFAGSTNGPEENFRTIQRGGARIEPIMYTQIGWNPADWAPEITLDDNGAAGGINPDYQAELIVNTNTYPTPQNWDILELKTIIYQGSNANLVSPGDTYKLQIDSNIITSQINLTLQVRAKFYNNSGGGSSAYARITRTRGGTNTIISGPVPINGTGFINAGAINNINFNHTIQYQDLVENDEYYVEVLVGHSNINTAGSKLNIVQTPTPTSTITVSNLWISSSGNTTTDILASASFDTSNIIYTTASLLVNNFDNPNTYFQDIAGSGFNPVNNPWVIKYGDEFRFENKEDRVYVVKGVERTTTGSLSIIAVQLDKPVFSGTNLNQFVIRRYVNDPGQVIMSGYKPAGIQDPYLIKPEFMSKKLEDNIDKYIKDLTEKGLI